jgi:hypothetical protein
MSCSQMPASEEALVLLAVMLADVSEGLYRPTGMLCLVCLCAHAAVVRTCECMFAQCGSVIARRS